MFLHKFFCCNNFKTNKSYSLIFFFSLDSNKSTKKKEKSGWHYSPLDASIHKELSDAGFSSS